jgi:uncharacterized protein (UPF0332 family)
MSFNWRDYLILAERSTADPNRWDVPEAVYRSAASRAYYAAFQCAAQRAIKEGFKPTYGGDDHILVPKYFREHQPSQIRRKIALELDRLRPHRHQADYNSDLGRPPGSLAQLAIGLAKSILANIDSLV